MFQRKKQIIYDDSDLYPAYKMAFYFHYIMTIKARHDFSSIMQADEQQFTGFWNSCLPEFIHYSVTTE